MEGQLEARPWVFGGCGWMPVLEKLDLEGGHRQGNRVERGVMVEEGGLSGRLGKLA